MKKIEYNYFNEFISVSKFIVESVEILAKTVNEYNLKKLEENIQIVHKLENDSDYALHQMRAYLIKDFLPPIDREDINLIGHKLDDIEDCIDELMINFNILNVEFMRDDMNQYMDLLITCINSVSELFVELKDFKKKNNAIKEKVIQINNLEEDGDRLFEKFIKNLYKDEKNPVEIIKWTTIYNCLENTFDACENIADCVDDVIMKIN